MSTTLKNPKAPKIPKSYTTKPIAAAKSLGARLKMLRKSKKITLVELAKSSGVDAATISRIETGRMTGTLESHFRIATALGLKLTELYAGIEEARIKDAVSLQLPSTRADSYVHQAGKSSMVILTNRVLEKKLMPALITIEPGGYTDVDETKVGVERFLYVLEGTIEAKIGDTTHTLKHGSSLYFDASIPHQLRNLSQKVSRCFAVTSPPSL